MSERTLKVLNRLGLHARPAAEFVRATRSFQCTVTLVKNGESYSAASILEVLSANLDYGSSFVLVAEGPDAEEALERLSGLLAIFREQEGE